MGNTERDEFKALLYNTYLDSVLPEEKVFSLNGALQGWIKKHIPQYLYRYRKISDYNLSALENDEIWGSSIPTFNDPYECTPSYDLVRVENEIHNQLNAEMVAEKYEEFKNGSSIDPVFSMFQDEDRDRLKQLLPDHVNVEQFGVGLANLEAVLINYLKVNYIEIVKDSFYAVANEQAKRLIACFSESFDSTLMWGHYTDCHKGFCVGYSLDDLVVNCSRSCETPKYCMNMLMNTPIAPVVYSNTRYDASATLMNDIMQYMSEKSNIPVKPLYEDYLFILKSLLTKSSAWSYEKEWRMIKTNPDYSKYGVICKHPAKAVYIGSKTTNEDAEKLYTICRKKNIECFKMLLDYYSGDYSLEPCEYSEYRKYMVKE